MPYFRRRMVWELVNRKLLWCQWDGQFSSRTHLKQARSGTRTPAHWTRKQLLYHLYRSWVLFSLETCFWIQDFNFTFWIFHLEKGFIFAVCQIKLYNLRIWQCLRVWFTLKAECHFFLACQCRMRFKSVRNLQGKVLPFWSDTRLLEDCNLRSIEYYITSIWQKHLAIIDIFICT